MEQSSSDEDDIPGVAVDGAGNTVNQNTSIIKQKINNTTYNNYYTSQGNGAQHQGPNYHGGRNPPNDHPPPPFPQQAEGDKAPENPGNDPQNRGPNNQNHSDGQPPAAPDEHPPPYFPREAERDRAPENPDDDSEKTAIDDKSETEEIDHVSEYNDNKNAPSLLSDDSGIQDESQGSSLGGARKRPRVSNTEEDTLIKEVSSPSQERNQAENEKKVKEEEGPLAKITKSAGSTDVQLFLIEDEADNLIQAEQFSEALIKLQQLPDVYERNFKVKWMELECMLRRGMKGTEEELSKLVDFVRVCSPDLKVEKLVESGTVNLNQNRHARAMILFASAAIMYLDLPPDNAAFQIGMCIYHFSDAIRMIPKLDENKKRKKGQRRTSMVPLERKFGLWHKSLSLLESMMNTMLKMIKNVNGAKDHVIAKHESWGLNWISAAFLYMEDSYVDKAIEYSAKGIAICETLEANIYSNKKTLSDLYYNNGLGKLKRGKIDLAMDLLIKSIDILENIQNCPTDKKAKLKETIKFRKGALKRWAK